PTVAVPWPPVPVPVAPPPDPADVALVVTSLLPPQAAGASASAARAAIHPFESLRGLVVSMRPLVRGGRATFTPSCENASAQCSGLFPRSNTASSSAGG